jgi:hypothetical protein
VPARALAGVCLVVPLAQADAARAVLVPGRQPSITLRVWLTVSSLMCGGISRAASASRFVPGCGYPAPAGQIAAIGGMA